MSWAADVVLSGMVIGKTEERERETATREEVSRAEYSGVNGKRLVRNGTIT